ncbi:Pyridoxine/pyridoxal/pyridoxamine kinase [Caprobacter fermentans]|uniref:pyridoxal kinase n=2 Tax=Caproicibacter fermentans TaxID=2576756 RepID=A0A6N8HVC3_9FIRM|nr:Pyridoxine/pyridoxal/pyridoxamine kinase [Caproicibacter fermentans]
MALNGRTPPLRQQRRDFFRPVLNSFLRRAKIGTLFDTEGDEMPLQKNVLAVHDISCVGKCSLTVALPILSAAGCTVSVLPTAVLSTHTGGFTGFTFRDLTEDIPKIADHWKSLGLRFDAFYTGYLGSFDQLRLVSGLIDELAAPGAMVCVDPVMADNGSLYASFGPEFPQGMAALCRKADLILPNRTEAALLLGEPYREGRQDRRTAEEMLRRLSELGPRRVVLTGVSFSAEQTGCAAYDRETGEFRFAFAPKIEGNYHGTGDVFASALIGALMNGFSLGAAAQEAVDFTQRAIARTHLAGTDVRYGVNFEEGIPSYAQRLAPDPEAL